MTDQTLGLPAGRPRSARLRSTVAQFLRRIELRPTTSWAVAALLVCLLTRHFWVDEGTFPNIRLHHGRDPGADRLRGPADAPGAVCDRAGRLAGRADRDHLLGQAGGHEHGHARLRPLLLSELLVDDQLPVERPAPLPPGSRRCPAFRGGRRLARLSRRRHARVPALGGGGPAGLRGARLVWRRRQGRAPAHAVLLREPLRLVLLRILGRDARGAVAGSAARGGAARGRGGPGLRHSVVVQCRRQAAAHHSDP